MPQAPTVRLVELLKGVDGLDRTLAVCHLVFITDRISYLKQQVFIFSEAHSVDLTHLWEATDELALQDALILFGTHEPQVESISSLWNLWGRLLSRHLVQNRTPNFHQIFGEVADMLDLFEVVRRRIVAMSKDPENDKMDFIYMLGSPVY